MGKSKHRPCGGIDEENNMPVDWKKAASLDIEELSFYILTGKTIFDFYPDKHIISKIGDSNETLRVLDFGCGVGRNTFAISEYSERWEVVGYDNQEMISKTPEYKNIKYGQKDFEKVKFSCDWVDIKNKKFDCILCCLVLQHIREDELLSYIADFQRMAKRLVVAGRRVNDFTGRSTWSIIEKGGHSPIVFLSGKTEKTYYPLGDAEEHNTAIYKFV